MSTNHQNQNLQMPDKEQSNTVKAYLSLQFISYNKFKAQIINQKYLFKMISVQKKIQINLKNTIQSMNITKIY